MPAPQADETIADFDAAAAASRATAARHGNLIELSNENADDVLLSADLHGNRDHFRRIVDLAELVQRPRRHLVLQEVCHGGPTYDSGGCQSHRLLEEVARLKLQHPQQVHFLLSNHELAEMTDFPIAKGNRMLNILFRMGMEEAWGDRTDDVRLAAARFLAACPLAVRMQNGIFLSHSVPDRVARDGFDYDIFRRELTPDDYEPERDVFRLVWGRDRSAANAKAFCEGVGAKLVVQGHIPCMYGVRVENAHQVVVDSSGPSGCCVLLPIRESITANDVAVRAVPLGPTF